MSAEYDPVWLRQQATEEEDAAFRELEQRLERLDEHGSRWGTPRATDTRRVT